MDHKIVIDAIGRHLDSLEAIVNAMVLLSVASAWAGVRRSSEIDALGTKLRRQHAFFALAGIYLLANVAVLVLFHRLADLLLLLDNRTAIAGLTKLATHQWILNPFSYFGTTTTSKLSSSIGFGLLIAVWWLGNASLSTLMDNKRHLAARLLLGSFLVVGLLSMDAVHRCYFVILETIPEETFRLRDEILSGSHYRMLFTLAGIGIGGAIFFFTNYLQHRIGLKSADQVKSSNIWSESPLDPSNRVIYMRNLPFLLSGWNGKYQQLSLSKNGKSVWVRRSHWYKGYFPFRIIGVSLWFDGKKWGLHRDRDPDDKVFARSLHASESPVGNWERNVTVSDSPTKFSL